LRNSSEPLCFISPCLPPSIDGIGDYQRQLWRNWSDCDGTDYHPDWTFLVSQGARESQEIWPEVRIRQFDLSREGLVKVLNEVEAKTAVLQYVGYGYDKQGQPMWLPQALKEWSACKSGRSVIVMFHETWASGYPWQRTFWLRGGQMQCAQQLLELSSHAVTSNNATLRDLRKLSDKKDVKLIPLGSSFTVSDSGLKDWRKLLIFGREHSRLRAIKSHRGLIHKLASSGLLDRIVLAGESSNPALDEGQGLIEFWKLPAVTDCFFNFSTDELPPDILECGLSLMHTESTCLLKSTSFQLAAQLAQVPIALQEAEPGQSVVQGKHYLGYRPGRIDDVLNQLRSLEFIASVSSELASLGRTDLSWPEIVRAWMQVFSFNQE